MIHRLADALGRPLRFVITPGQTGDVTQAPALLHGPGGEALLADNAYDSKALRTIIADMGAEAVIPSSRSRKIAILHDTIVYKLRNRATRYDHRTIHFAGSVHLVAAMIWLR